MAFTALVGARVRRREDPRLITGRATYTDDVRQIGTPLLCVRAQRLRARKTHQRRCQARALAARRGCGLQRRDVQEKASRADFRSRRDRPARIRRCTISWPSMKSALPGNRSPSSLPIRTYTARDAAEAVEVSYDELPVVVDVLKAAQGAPFVHEQFGTNVAYTMPLRAGDPDAALSRRRIRGPRSASSTSALRRCRWKGASRSRTGIPGNGQLTMWVSTQIPHHVRTQLARMLASPRAACGSSRRKSAAASAPRPTSTPKKCSSRGWPKRSNGR